MKSLLLISLLCFWSFVWAQEVTIAKGGLLWSANGPCKKVSKSCQPIHLLEYRGNKPYWTGANKPDQRLALERVPAGRVLTSALRQEFAKRGLELPAKMEEFQIKQSSVSVALDPASGMALVVTPAGVGNPCQDLTGTESKVCALAQPRERIPAFFAHDLECDPNCDPTTGICCRGGMLANRFNIALPNHGISIQFLPRFR